MRQAFVHRLAMRGPGDTDGLEAAIAAGTIRPEGIVAILGKTEGNGCVNDFSRGFATQSLSLALRRHMPQDAADKVCLVMSGGTEGVLSPHMTVFEVREVSGPAGRAALALGRARTPELPPEAIGRLAQVEAVAAGVVEAVSDAGILSVDDVHFVQVKCPLLTAERVAEAASRGETTATRDTLKSMSVSRAASALGVALALGEVERSAVTQVSIGSDWSLYSHRASTSAGVELVDHEIIVMGTSPNWRGPLRIDHAVMGDGIDIEPVRAALARLGLATPGQLVPSQRQRLVGLFGKADPGTSGQVRGLRHTMLDDSDIAATRHARAFVGGVLASLVGHGEIYVSGGAEHQGPDGGGPVAVIVSAQ
jgi:cyanuric acid amidohydrolase